MAESSGSLGTQNTAMATNLHTGSVFSCVVHRPQQQVSTLWLSGLHTLCGSVLCLWCGHRTQEHVRTPSGSLQIRRQMRPVGSQMVPSCKSPSSILEFSGKVNPLLLFYPCQGISWRSLAQSPATFVNTQHGRICLRHTNISLWHMNVQSLMHATCDRTWHALACIRMTITHRLF